MSSLMETLVNDGRFNTFVSALQASNLSDTLHSTGPFTVFAPTDDAFAGLAEGTVDKMMDDVPSLTRVTTYHLVSGLFSADAVEAQERLTTVEGSDVRIQRLDSRAFVDDALIVDSDLNADNGVIHAVDAVLLPPDKA